jgi:hypothetical protein
MRLCPTHLLLFFHSSFIFALHLYSYHSPLLRRLPRPLRISHDFTTRKKYPSLDTCPSQIQATFVGRWPSEHAARFQEVRPGRSTMGFVWQHNASGHCILGSYPSGRVPLAPNPTAEPAGLVRHLRLVPSHLSDQEESPHATLPPRPPPPHIDGLRADINSQSIQQHQQQTNPKRS